MAYDRKYGKVTLERGNGSRWLVGPAECDERGVPLDWERCRQCAVDSTGGTVSCPICAGHGSLKAAALAAVLAERRVTPMLNIDNACCEDCGHPMSDGTWEGTHPRLDVLMAFAATELRDGFEPRTELFTRGADPELPGPSVIHYSSCDEGCEHGEPGRASANLNLRGETVGRVLAKAAGYGIKPLPTFQASWRAVDVRTLGWPHDLRTENLAVLCLRCFAARSPVTEARRKRSSGAGIERSNP
jgi:hypothetical protein